MKLLLFVLALVFMPTLVVAEIAAPRPPCTIAPIPAYALPGAPPAEQVWQGSDLARAGWAAAPCIGWSPSSRSKLVLALAGSFQFDGTVDDLLGRIGAISTLPGVRYWSTTDRKWRVLIVDAAALLSSARSSRRQDFSAAELASGQEYLYLENDSRSGEVVYRIQVRERSQGHAVITTENLTPIRFLLVTLFKPGALQSVEFIDEIAPGIWGVYLLVRTNEGASWLAGENERSYINRAAAVFRHLAGIPTDQEPPAAP